MGPLDYAEKRIKFVLSKDGLAAMDGNPEIGYLTRRDIEKSLADIAAEAGYKIGEEVVYRIFVERKS